MSYCRFGGGSDVYMFLSVDGVVECCGCLLQEDGGNVQFKQRSEALKHLEDHIKNGDRVPSYVFVKLQREIEEEGNVVESMEEL